MAKELKYIIVKQGGFKTPILFDDTISHNEFDKIFRKSVISAGFFDTSIVDGEIRVSTFGRSVSMKVESRPQDAALIEKFLNHSFD